MPKLSPVLAFDKILSKLIKQWREHRDALAKIEAIFAKYNINPAKLQPASPALMQGAEDLAHMKKRRRRRQQFAQTADEFILGLLSGGKSPTTAQINADWIKSGRAGKADNTLTKMVQGRKLKREAVKNGRGSRYSAV